MEKKKPNAINLFLYLDVNYLKQQKIKSYSNFYSKLRQESDPIQGTFTQNKRNESKIMNLLPLGGKATTEHSFFFCNCSLLSFLSRFSEGKKKVLRWDISAF